MPDLFQETKALLRKLHIAPRKRMGQNFMINPEGLSMVTEALCLKEGEMVLEIGPGLGFLTRELLRKKTEVTAVEKDAPLAEYIAGNFKNPRFRLVEGDILKLDLEKDLQIDHPIKVAGNIPYQITSPILEWLVGQRRRVSQVVLTTQWEVALRLTANPGSKSWGALSIFVQVYALAEIIKKISRSYFYPIPKVDSAVVRLDFSKGPRFPIEDHDRFFRIVRRAFQKRRKTILNSLADKHGGAYSKETVLRALEEAKIDPLRRPETLSIPEWACLCEILG